MYPAGVSMTWVASIARPAETGLGGVNDSYQGAMAAVPQYLIMSFIV
jgi:hypothetical protein